MRPRPETENSLPSSVEMKNSGVVTQFPNTFSLHNAKLIKCQVEIKLLWLLANYELRREDLWGTGYIDSEFLVLGSNRW